MKYFFCHYGENHYLCRAKNQEWFCTEINN